MISYCDIYVLDAFQSGAAAALSPSRSLSGGGDGAFGEGGSSSAGDGAIQDEMFDGSGEQEGFICPSCMRGFASPEKLQVKHCRWLIWGRKLPTEINPINGLHLPQNLSIP